MYRIGIIGCGRIAQVRHIPEYTANPEAQLTGFFDLNENRAHELATAHGGKAYPSYRELLEDPSIEAVSVCAANNAHAEITVAALKAGKHVLCEKPMATTLTECEAMVSAAREAGKLLLIGHNQRLAKAHVRAKELLEQGLIGEVVTFRTTFGHGGPETWSIDAGKNVWFFDRRRATMGAMADLGIHKTDLIQFLLGQKIVETTARVVTLNKRDASGSLIGVDDNAVCIYRTDGGAVGTMTASWTYYGAEDNSTVLYGTKGIMRIYDDPAYSVKVVLANGETALFQVDRIQTNDSQTKSGVIDEFVDCIKTGRPSVLSGEEALSAMRAVFASIESSETGRTVRVDRTEGGNVG